MTTCGRCALETYEVNTPMMPGHGPIDAEVFLCAEAPGHEEDKLGRPLVGKAGQLLRTEWEKILGYPLDKVFLTNVCKCRPKDNRTPYKKEATACWPLVEHELEMVKPKLVVAVGRLAMQMFGVKGKITSCSGKIYEVGDLTIIPLIHPAAILRNARQIAIFRKALEQIKSFLDHGHEVDYGEYSIVEANDYEGLERSLTEVVSAEVTDIDIETNGLDAFAPDARVKCISFSPSPRRSVCVNLEGWEDGDRLTGMLRAVLSDPTIGKSGQQLAFEYVWLKQVLGITLRGIKWDTCIGSFELDKLSNPGLKDQSWKTGLGGYEGEFSSGKKVAASEGEELFRYCAMDSDATGRLRQLQYGELSPAQRQYMEKQALPLIRVLSEMHLRGLRVDTDRLDRVERLSSNLIEYLESRIRSHKYVRRAESSWEFGRFNPKSTRQIRAIVYGILGAPVRKESPRGAPSTDEETLKWLEPDYPSFIRPLLDYRTAQKFKSTYITAVRRNLALDGRIHSWFSQTTATTGRLASRRPNVQNWPHKPKDLSGRYPEEYRACFEPRNFVIPENGCELWGADFSQQELRIAAAVSQDPVMVKIFKEGGDIHRETALIFDSNYDSLDEDGQDRVRRFAKTVNFGIIYGMSAFELARRTGMSETQAKEFIAGFFRKYWGYAKWVDDTKRFLDSHGYVETPTGRRRNFPPLEDLGDRDRAAVYREAVNTPIQGPASELCANALLRMERACTKYKLRSFWVNTIHDENIANGYPEEWKDFREIYEEVAINPPEWLGGFLKGIPLKVDWKRGPRWGEMEKLK